VHVANANADGTTALVSPHQAAAVVAASMEKHVGVTQ
jgi:hypothetical protein